MEINGKKLLGLPVFAIDNGQKLGQVKDYLFDPATGRVLAFFVARRGLLKDDLLLPLADAKHIGLEAATVEWGSLLISQDERPEWATLIKALPDIIGLPLMTEDGVFLGKATGFRLETTTGEITAVELQTTGLRRRLLLRREDIVVFGSDVVLTQRDAQRRVASPEKIKERRLASISKLDLDAVRTRLHPSRQERGIPVAVAAEEESVKEILAAPAAEGTASAIEDDNGMPPSQPSVMAAPAAREFQAPRIHYRRS